MIDPDYSVYLPGGAVADAWGVCVTAAGHTRVRPNAPYPPGRHPDDHALSWERGRVLNEYQIVYITQGEGRFESAAAGQAPIHAGTAFILFPGMWHRYEPLRATGWVEDWVELNGPAMDRLARRGVIAPRQAVFPIGLDPAMVELFRQCHQLARGLPAGHQPVLAVLGLQILARMLFAAASSEATSDADEGVRQAQALMAASAGRPLNMEQLADEVGMSYSYFRRAFKSRTGLSPKQYHLQLRLRKAQELLAHSSLSIKQIADELGYDSPFHLSADFRGRVGASPSRWRAEILAKMAIQTGKSSTSRRR